jgi:hypothetical protein
VVSKQECLQSLFLHSPLSLTARIKTHPGLRFCCWAFLVLVVLLECVAVSGNPLILEFFQILPFLELFLAFFARAACLPPGGFSACHATGAKSQVSQAVGQFGWGRTTLSSQVLTSVPRLGGTYRASHRAESALCDSTEAGQRHDIGGLPHEY